MAETTPDRAGMPAPGSPAVFTRNATGLVRGVKPWTAAIINFLPGHPAQSLAVGFFFVFAVFPGGSYLLGLAFLIPLSLAMSYSFGLLTTMMPRSGGDYILVSRVLHPMLGLVSSFCMTLANLLSNAFFGIAVVTIGLGPGLTGLGLINHNATLIRWGADIQTKNWEFGIGTIMFLIPVAVLAANWTWARRALNIGFWMVSGGLLIAVVVAIFTSQSHFAGSFNSFAASYTGKPDTYHDVIKSAQSAGIPLNPAFSFSNTIPIMGIFAAFSIYSYFATFVGGELRQASSIKTAHSMAITGVTAIVLSGLFAAIFFHSFGKSFVISANGAGLGAKIPVSPTYFFLSSVSVGNTLYASIMVICYIMFWPLIAYLAFLQPTRMLFAYAFDGILPKGVTKVSRVGSPYIALAIAYILTELTFLWALNSSSFLQVLVYATLFQLFSMGLVGLSAVLVPYLRPEFYRASASRRTFAGIPLVSICGAFAIATCAGLWVMYFHYAPFGLADRQKFLTFFVLVVGGALVYYAIARAVRMRQGVDIRRAYVEIPPE
jgi:basic amino acid/polyamine antiporter, APA family